jgi:hypothetical protein
MVGNFIKTPRVFFELANNLKGYQLDFTMTKKGFIIIAQRFGWDNIMFTGNILNKIFNTNILSRENVVLNLLFKSFY